MSNTSIKMIKKTTPKQFETLVDAMCKNPNIAKGYHKISDKSSIKEKWNDIKKKLNSIGPPSRGTEGWMKVWSDMKTSVKRKLMHNKTESRATGGGSFNQKTLTPLEEAVSGSLQLDSVISPEGPKFGIENVPVDLNEEICRSELNNDATMENISMDIQTDPISTKRKRNSKTVEKNLLLEQQLKIQTDLYKDLKRSLSEIERYNRKTYKIQEELLKVKKEKIALYKEQVKKKEVHRSNLLKMRMEEIELKRRKIEIEENRISC